METLGKLFGSETKVKIMRLFLFSPDRIFDSKTISEKIDEDTSRVRREILLLEKIDFLKRRVGSRNGKHVQGYIMNTNFSYLLPLQNFLINLEPLQPKELIKKISKLGSIKLIIVAGVFIQDPESRVDVFIVGDGIKRSNLESLMLSLEAEIGKELKYAHFTTEDFKYRLSMFDKLTRDILDYPHKKILNKLGLE
ncbi:MAG TPA: hypothetical protein PLZ99_01180 [Parcubacteria group bacterium]|nr:hypothetical protein [Parcubacteria group bacterium]